MSSQKVIKVMRGLVTLFLFLSILTTSIGAAALPENWPNSIVISAGPMGGNWYVCCAKFSEYLMEAFPGLSVTVIEGVATGNIRLIDEGRDAQIAMSHTPTWYWGRSGKLFEGKEYTNSLAAFTLAISHVQFVVRADSDIYSFADLKDKRLCVGKYNGVPDILFRELLKLYDLDYETIRKNGGKITYGNYPEMGSLMLDNHIDAFVVMGNLNFSTVLEVQSRIPLKLIPIEDNKLEVIKEKIPGVYITTIQPGLYFEGDKDSGDANLLSFPGVFIVNKDLPEDFMYEVTKLYMSKAPEVKEFLSREADLWAMGWEGGKKGIVKKEDMHPGCLRAFEEAGYGFED